MMRSEITIRRGTPEDMRAAFDVSMAAMRDLFTRQGHEWTLDPDSFWTVMQPFLVHLSVHAAEWWVAEDPSDRTLLGYARSVERGGLFELSELFVRPGLQSAGLGSRLIERAFPLGRGEVRVIIATTDVRGLARYYGAGTVARFAIASLAAPPQPSDPGELEVVAATIHDVAELAAIERAVVGYPRVADYPWLCAQREAYLYRRDGRAVGFAFFSETGQGPIAALEAVDQRSILLHLEALAHARGMDSVYFEVPMINEVAMRHLLARGFKFDAPLTLLMANVAFGKFDRFIGFSPGIVL